MYDIGMTLPILVHVHVCIHVPCTISVVNVANSTYTGRGHKFDHNGGWGMIK